MSKQLTLFSNLESESKKEKRAGTFTDNMKLPVHRWFRYSAGFSAQWIMQLISDNQKPHLKILDPFAGSGTTLIAADSCEVSSVGIEAHPFVTRIARAKLLWNRDADRLIGQIKTLTEKAQIIERTEAINIEELPVLLKKVYSKESLNRLISLKKAWENQQDESAHSELMWLALTAILRVCSHAGTAPWQYVLPNKRKSKVLDPYEAIKAQSNMMAADMVTMQNQIIKSHAQILCEDARKPEGVEEKSIDLVVTSPPYPNNYDYADATRLEMTFWGDVKTWGDLHEAARKYLLRSCSQHAAKDKLVLDEVLTNPYLDPIRTGLTAACKELEKIRQTKSGKKAYHTMAAAYFSDLGQVFHSLRAVVKNNGQVCFVIGDSAPYGIYLPVDEWLGELAIAAGFKSVTFEKIRDRNIKWKNRKHRVPLKEGKLWIQG